MGSDGVAGVLPAAAGFAGDGIGTPRALHWLAGGAWTRHAPGSCVARAPSRATPSVAAVPPSTAQRHLGLDASTPDTAEQHAVPGPGAVALPDMYPMHGDRLTSSGMHPEPLTMPDEGAGAGACAAHRHASSAAAMARARPSAATST